MRIRQLVLVGATLAAVAVGAHLAALQASNDEGERLDHLRSHLDRLSRDASGLLALSQDVVLHGGGRAALQWRATHGRMLQALGQALPAARELGDEMADMQAVLGELPTLFAAVEAAGGHGSAERRDQLVDLLVQQTHRISESAFDIAARLSAQRQQRRLAERHTALAAWAGVLALVTTFLVVAWRRVLRPTANLQAATRALLAGDRSARSGYRADDELGQLALAFDEMAAALQQHDLRQQQALRENEALLTTIRPQALISMADRAGTIIDVNDNFCAISGYTRAELLGQNHRIVNSGVQPPEFWAGLWRTIAAGRPWRGEICNRAKDGSLYWVDSIIAPFFGDDGGIEKYVSIRMDITAAKEAARRVVDGEAFLRMVTDGLPVRIAYLDTARRFRFVNAAHCRRFGLAREAILGRTRAELGVGGPAAARVEAAIDAALAGAERRLEYEEPVDGEPRWIESHLIPDRDAHGAVRGVFTTGVDITERRRAEAQMLETSRLLASVLDAATEVAVIATATDGTIRLFNRGAEKMLGYGADEVVGRMRSLELHERTELAACAAGLSRRLGRHVHSGLVLVQPEMLAREHEWRYVRKDGAHVPVRLTLTAMHDGAGALSGYLGVAYDISERRRFEASLRQAVQEANDANAAKSRFLANTSHEIRTPMNAVIGLTYLLGRTRLDETQAGYVGKLQLASKRLLGLINDILDLSKVEAGELTLEHTPFDVARLVRELADECTVQADAKGVAFGCERAPALPPALVGDPTRLAQVVGNLLSNALKFTPRGGRVTLDVQCPAATAAQATLRFAVRDTGIGIDPAVQQRLFVPFAQADTSTTRRFGGTGLGLSIVKHLTERMGGRLTLRSAPGEGSEFAVEFDLPLPPPGTAVEDLAASSPDPEPLRRTRVLVVDDSEVNLEVARRQLAAEGAHVETAASGEQALALLRQRPGDFDIVLLDMQMPEMDGVEVARRIRGTPGLAKLPIVAWTAAMLASEVDRATAVGIDGFAEKPFDAAALVRTLRALLPPAAAAAAAAVAAAPQAAAPDASPPPWPDIAGIDRDGVRQRLGDDVRLFASMLERLLAEFDGLALAPGTDAAALHAHGRRMHKLHGTAGLLGATSVHELAGEAEDACRRADAALAGELTAALADELAALRRDAQPVLRLAAEAAAASAAAGAGAMDTPVDRARLAIFHRRLQQQDLAAIQDAAQLAVQLERLLGQPACAQLQRHVDRLEFDAAARLLEPVIR
ncbi:MAG: PAS domain S-box protein [Betaproteobacteria bacterium]|nr:PAS domain S-box protein [Betaproteobacteria bacterium]